MAKPPRPGSSRPKKGAQIGTGGHGRKALEGKGPTPKAEDRHWYRDKKRSERPTERPGAEKSAGSAPGPRPRASSPRASSPGASSADVVVGRNAVVEALRAKIPATSLTLAHRVEHDGRIREALELASKQGIPLLEVTRPELDRLAGDDQVHQGIALQIPPYRYAHPMDLADLAQERGDGVLVALDGITDPRNLGAIIRSTAAFGGQGVIVPQRRSVGVTPAVWKTSAGQLTHAPVALAGNLTRALEDLKARGFFVVGLAGDAPVAVQDVDVAGVPVVVVVGAEGAGLSRLVREACDLVVSIPMDPRTESLNAAVACGIVLHEIHKSRRL